MLSNASFLYSKFLRDCFIHTDDMNRKLFIFILCNSDFILTDPKSNPFNQLYVQHIYVIKT